MDTIIIVIGIMFLIALSPQKEHFINFWLMGMAETREEEKYAWKEFEKLRNLRSRLIFAAAACAMAIFFVRSFNIGNTVTIFSIDYNVVITIFLYVATMILLLAVIINKIKTYLFYGRRARRRKKLSNIKPD
ncbi:MAG: hypothetical protein LBC95_01515 [Candidatus Nomurabacteria bacterium]|jgi:hypothetical protein|nr:hypothetical protein [Candidatus Nomurabacteria bacterium]